MSFRAIRENNSEKTESHALMEFKYVPRKNQLYSVSTH